MNLLTKEERMHGYKLTQQYKEIMQQPVKEGMLYPMLHLLEAEGMLVTETAYVGKRVRKYYSLSPKAKKKGKRNK